MREACLLYSAAFIQSCSCLYNNSGDDSSLLILNGWKLDNPPLKLSWLENAKTEDNSTWIQNFNNDDAYRIRWACSAVLNDTMYMVGGLPDGDQEITNVYKIRDCDIVKTDHTLPWTMAGHSCTVKDEKLYICGSMMNLMERNCTVFDGEKFSKLESTQVGHTFGAMVTFQKTPFILGGMGDYNAIDTDHVEIYMDKLWTHTKPLPLPMRLFSVAVMDQKMWIFGGISANNNFKELKSSWSFTGDTWTQGPDLMNARHGHRTINYFNGLMHIGGNGTQPIERWNEESTGKFEMLNSDVKLPQYVDFPEIFFVSNSFCRF